MVVDGGDVAEPRRREREGALWFLEREGGRTTEREEKTEKKELLT